MNRGIQRERAVAAVLRRHGYLVASLRHEFGAGDLLAVSAHTNGSVPPLLVEVKGTTDYPWRSTWGPQQRALMLQAGLQWGLEPMLAWWPPHLQGGPIWLTAEDWPA
jgi:hypothetical protein